MPTPSSRPDSSGRPTANTGFQGWLGRSAPALAVGVTLLAMLLRVHRLADQNIWWDEGWSLWLAHQDWASSAWRTAQDAHPPLHFWLLHVWVNLVGPEAFTGRLFSVFFGVLMVAMMYRLARQAGGPGLGVVAAFLLAASRFHVAWSQEVKNYALAGFFVLASAWCTLALFTTRETPRRPLWVIYVVATTLALYSHYLTALSFLVHNLFVAIQLLGRWRRGAEVWRPFTHWSLAQLAVLILVAPWLWLYTQAQSTDWQPVVQSDFGFFARLIGAIYSTGVTNDIERVMPVVVLMVALAGLGLWSMFERGAGSPARRRAALWGALTATAAPLLTYALSLTPAAFSIPHIDPRHLLTFLPGYLLLVALGLAQLNHLSRRLSGAIFVGLVFVQGMLLNDYYRGRVLRDEYATLANTINTFAQPGDLVLLQTDQEWPTFLYYLRAPIPWMGVPSASLLDDRGAQGLASSALLRSNAIWLVAIPDALAKDPQHLLDKWLASGRPRQFERVFGDKRLVLYAAAPRDMAHVPPENFQPEEPRADQLSPELELIGLDLPIDTARGGETVHVVTYWDANSPITLTVELRDPSGATVRAASQPLIPGDRVRAQSDLRLPPRPNGEFTIVADVGEVLHPLATILAAPRFVAPRVATIPNPVDYRLGEGIALAGYELSPTELRPGDELAVTLFWRSDRAVETGYKVFVHLVGAELNPAQNNPLWGQADQLPLNGDLPTNAWAPGDLIPDPYRVRLDPHAPPGDYQVSVGLYDPVSGERLRVTDPAGREVGDAIVIGTVRVR